MVSSTRPRTEATEQPQQAPATPGHWLWGNARDLLSNGPEFLAAQVGSGGVVRLRELTIPVYLVLDAQGIQHVLQANNRNYTKQTIEMGGLRYVLGDGLLTNDGQAWLRQRRLIQPAFHRQQLASLGSVMVAGTREMLDRWERLPEGTAVDLSEEMTRLALDIAGHAFFSADTTEDAEAFGRAVGDAGRLMAAYFRRPFPPLNVPTPSHRALRAEMRKIEAVVDRIIAARRRDPGDRGDLLSMLLEARDAETGEGMSDQQVRAEVMTLLLAGHETTANGLTWLWYLISQHPEVEDRLHREVDTALAGSEPSVQHLSALPYTRMVVDESMRVYPPVWFFTRRAVDADVVAGYRIPRHATVFMSPYATHRDPTYWPDPDRFDPERFMPERVAERPRFAYFPFAGGPRQCIGNSFALMEMPIVVAMVAQRYRLRLQPGWQASPEGLVTLRPRGGMPMLLDRRAPVTRD